MDLIAASDPILKLKCQNFNFMVPAFEPIEFAKELIKLLYDKGGISIAANQVGVHYRVIAMRGSPENFVCYNPRIVDTSEETIFLEEVCLTYPGLAVKIKRPRRVRIRFNTPNGDIQTRVFDGMTARVLQHELDHLDGLIFYNKAIKYHRDKAMKKWSR